MEIQDVLAMDPSEPVDVAEELLRAFVLVAFVLEGRKAQELKDRLCGAMYNVAKALPLKGESVADELGVRRQTLNNWAVHSSPWPRRFEVATLLVLAGKPPDQRVNARGDVAPALKRLRELRLVNKSALEPAGVDLMRQLVETLEGLVTLFPSSAELGALVRTEASRPQE